MKFSLKHQQIRLVLEIMIWSVFLGLPLFVIRIYNPFPEEEISRSVMYGVILVHTLLIGFYYFNFYFALPRLYFTRRYSLYFPLLFLILLALILLLQIRPEFNPIPSGMTASRFIFIFSIVVRFIVVFLLSLGFSAYSRLRQAEEEKLKTELSYLKSQINPHFLFNTLNSLYALSVKKSDAAPIAITRLSSIMRYVISEAKEDLVALDKELEYVRSYIELEKLRLTDKVNLDFSVSGETPGLQIAPFIFLPLIENAFKHGVSTTEQSDISIHLVTEKKKLTLTISNTRVRTDKNKSNGLGLANMKKRLELLYAGHYSLNTEEELQTYKTRLILEL
jgi:sensor histidine kinase YesM